MATLKLNTSAVIDGRKGSKDMTVGAAIEWYLERGAGEDGEPTESPSQAAEFLVVYAVRRMMALHKDDARHGAGKAPTHIYLPRPVDGAKHAAKLAPAVDAVRGEFAKLIWGAKGAPVEPKPAKPTKPAKPAPVEPKPAPKPIPPKAAERAAKRGATPPVRRTDLTPATIASAPAVVATPAPVVKTAPDGSKVYVTKGGLMVEDSTGI